MERDGFAAAREDLATTRERLRRFQEEDLARALSDLVVARTEVKTATAARDALDRSLAEERDARRASEEAFAMAKKEAEAARDAAVDMEKERNIREDNTLANVDEAIAVAEQTAAEARAAGEERDAAQREVKAFHARCVEARAAQQAAEKALDGARAEVTSLKTSQRAAEEEVCLPTSMSSGDGRLKSMLSKSFWNRDFGCS